MLGYDSPAREAMALLDLSARDIDGLGWLSNPSDEIKTWSLMIIPIRVGGRHARQNRLWFQSEVPNGFNFARSLWLSSEERIEMYLADSPEAFADACIRAIREPEKAAQMAERAWCQYLEKWTWEAIHPSVWAAAEDCLRRSG